MAAGVGVELCVVAEVAIDGAVSYDGRCVEGVGVLERRAACDVGVRWTAAYYNWSPVNIENCVIWGAPSDSSLCGFVLMVFDSDSNRKCRHKALGLP